MALNERRAWWTRTAAHAAVLAGLIFAGYVLLVAAPGKGTLAMDVVSYWSFDLAHPYAGQWGDDVFFAYSPPIALVVAPFTALPFGYFLVLWYALLIGAFLALAWLGRVSPLVLLALPPVAINLSDGNIHLLLALAIVLGFRYPAAWSFVLLTKVTPGVGLLWFVARREWRALAVASGTTAVIVAATVVILPTQWAEWVAVLTSNAGVQPPPPAFPIPLWIRLPAAAALVWWGARRNRRWTVLLAAALAEPALWPGSFAILAGWWAVRRIDRATSTASDRRYDAPDAGHPRGERPREPDPVSV